MAIAILTDTAPDSPFEPAVEANLSRFRLFSEEAGCAHDELVFDEINDVRCKHCGKDFTD